MTGFVLADQIRSIDPAQRLRRLAGRASPQTVAEVQAHLRPIIGLANP